jgi:RNA recognition motif-containing protein
MSANDELDHVLENLASGEPEDPKMDYAAEGVAPTNGYGGGEGGEVKKSKRVFVSNLSYSTSWQTLKDFMGQSISFSLFSSFFLLFKEGR